MLVSVQLARLENIIGVAALASVGPKGNQEYLL